MISPAIGIDLGTSYSCVGVWINDSVQIIPNEEGDRITPSFIVFDDTQRLIGGTAQNQASRNQTNTIFATKRLIGKRFSDSMIQKDLKYWPFNIESGKGKDNKPLIVIEYKGQIRKFLPEIICSMIIQKMKETAEQYLGQKITKTVLTVPANYNFHQRQAIYDAGTIAGMEVLRIINESTAAALAYRLINFTQKNAFHEKLILVFNLGGGTLNVSLVLIEDGIFEVKATAGNDHLGGEDFDNMLVDYCCAEFKRKKGVDLKKNPRSLYRLRIQCERAKRMLSIQNETTIEVDSLISNVDFSITITRQIFEDMCKYMFKQCIQPVEQVLKDSGLKKTLIHDVVLVGGSTRIPKLQELLKNYFNGKELNKQLNQDEAVAYGAAVQAAIITGQQKTIDFLLLDVTPQSIGVEITGGIMNVVIPKNQRFPIRKSQIFNGENNVKLQMPIKIYEGERKNTEDCQKLGQFNLDGIITPLLRSLPKIQISIDIDQFGMLKVTAVDMSTNKATSITIGNGNFSKKEIDLWIQELEKFKVEDHIIKDKNEAMNCLEQTIHTITSTLKNQKIMQSLSLDEKNKLKSSVDEKKKWFDAANPQWKANDYKTQLNCLLEVFAPIMKNASQATRGDIQESSEGFLRETSPKGCEQNQSLHQID